MCMKSAKAYVLNFQFSFGSFAICFWNFSIEVLCKISDTRFLNRLPVRPQILCQIFCTIPGVAPITWEVVWILVVSSRLLQVRNIQEKGLKNRTKHSVSIGFIKSRRPGKWSGHRKVGFVSSRLILGRVEKIELDNVVFLRASPTLPHSIRRSATKTPSKSKFSTSFFLDSTVSQKMDYLFFYPFAFWNISWSWELKKSLSGSGSCRLASWKEKKQFMFFECCNPMRWGKGVAHILMKIGLKGP